ncbi:MAG: hypothetical protein NTV05_02935 [Acidobacteria bacterium]|nr:hypothetical protein [Acidobacteriota bacterium]
MARDCNQNILKVLRLSRDMMLLADHGDQTRLDTGCGVLFGTLRDTAYKLRNLAEQEMQVHRNAGIRDTKEPNVG